MYSTDDVILHIPGYLSMRNTELGTWFVRDLVEVFAKEAHREDVLSMITQVWTV